MNHLIAGNNVTNINIMLVQNWTKISLLQENETVLQILKSCRANLDLRYHFYKEDE